MPPIPLNRLVGGAAGGVRLHSPAACCRSSLCRVRIASRTVTTSSSSFSWSSSTGAASRDAAPLLDLLRGSCGPPCPSCAAVPLEKKKRRSRIRLQYRRAKRSGGGSFPPLSGDPSAGSRSISANQQPRAAVTQGNGTSGATFQNKSVTRSTTVLQVTGMLNFIRALKV